MTDRELLELAAKAADYPIHSDAWAVGLGGGTPALYMGNHGPKWNPLTDDGDALRLAVKLGIDIGKAQVDYWDKSSNDPYAATRRAIVRAAAEIGKEMK
jgi:hypothetical protein